MPTIFFHGPALEKEKKKVFVQKLTELASEATGIPTNAFTIYLQEANHDSVSVGGKLLSDRQPR